MQAVAVSPSCTALAIVVLVMALVNVATGLFFVRQMRRPPARPTPAAPRAASESTEARARRLHREFNVALEDLRSAGWQASVRGIQGKAFLYLDPPQSESENGDETKERAEDARDAADDSSETFI